MLATSKRRNSQNKLRDPFSQTSITNGSNTFDGNTNEDTGSSPLNQTDTAFDSKFTGGFSIANRLPEGQRFTSGLSNAIRETTEEHEISQKRLVGNSFGGVRGRDNFDNSLTSIPKGPPYYTQTSKHLPFSHRIIPVYVN